MSATDRAFVEGFAAAHGLRAEWEGELGFCRECVGLLEGDRDSYVAWNYDDDSRPGIETPDAYHKDSYIAVLGRGDAAEAQLAAWVRKLAAAGVRFERRAKEFPDIGSVFFGWGDELTAVTEAQA